MGKSGGGGRRKQLQFRLQGLGGGLTKGEYEAIQF